MILLTSYCSTNWDRSMVLTIAFGSTQWNSSIVLFTDRTTGSSLCERLFGSTHRQQVLFTEIDDWFYSQTLQTSSPWSTVHVLDTSARVVVVVGEGHENPAIARTHQAGLVPVGADSMKIIDNPYRRLARCHYGNQWKHDWRKDKNSNLFHKYYTSFLCRMIFSNLKFHF